VSALNLWLCRACVADGEVYREPNHGSTCGRCGLTAIVPSQVAPVARASADPEALWKVPQVATYLGMSASWVKQASAEGLLPTVRVGRSLRYRPERIRAVLDSGLPSIRSSRKRRSH